MGAKEILTESAHRVGLEYTNEEAEQLAGGIGSVDITQDTEGDQGVNTIRVTFAVKDKNDLPVNGHVRAYLSDASNGLSLVNTAPTGGLSIGAKGEIFLEEVTNKMFTAVTDGNGVFDIDIVDTGTPKTFWPVVMNPDGSIFVGPAVTFQ